MTTATIETFKLRNGVLVLAKNCKRNGIVPVTYTNNTQATKCKLKLQEQGIDCHVSCGYPIFIVIK